MIDFSHAFDLIESLNLKPSLGTEDFVAAVRPGWELLFPCTEQLETEPSSDLGGTYDNLDEFNRAQAALIDHIRKLPRGAWGTITQRMPTGDELTDAVIAAGGGSISRRCFTTSPTFAEVLDKLVYDEIYAARQQFRAFIRAREVQAGLSANGWRVGSVVQNVSVSGSHYRSLEITAVYADGIVVEAITRSGREKHTYKLQPREIEVLGTKAAA